MQGHLGAPGGFWWPKEGPPGKLAGLGFLPSVLPARPEQGGGIFRSVRTERTPPLHPDLCQELRHLARAPEEMAAGWAGGGRRANPSRAARALQGRRPAGAVRLKEGLSRRRT